MPLNEKIAILPVLSLMKGEAVDGRRQQVSQFLNQIFDQVQNKPMPKTLIVSADYSENNRWVVLKFHRMLGGSPQTGVLWTANVQVITSDLTHQDDRIVLRLIEMTNNQVYPGESLSDDARNDSWADLRSDLLSIASSIGQVA